MPVVPRRKLPGAVTHRRQVWFQFQQISNHRCSGSPGNYEIIRVLDVCHEGNVFCLRQGSVDPVRPNAGAVGESIFALVDLVAGHEDVDVLFS